MNLKEHFSDRDCDKEKDENIIEVFGGLCVTVWWAGQFRQIIYRRVNSVIIAHYYL